MDEVRLSAATSAEQLSEFLERWSGVHGWSGYIFAHRSSAWGEGARWQVEQVSESAQGMIGDYFAQGFDRIDPVARHIRGSRWPIRWTLPDYNDGEGGDAVASLLEASGFASGVAIPLRGWDGAIGTIALLSAEPEVPLQTMSGTARDNFPISLCLARLACLPPPAKAGPPLLTEREAECLAWVAAGKTSWEIGKIVGIKLRTVEFHVSNCVQKLGCSSRSQAVCRATQMGLLDGPPKPAIDGAPSWRRVHDGAAA